ncbi:hypothetical protein RISK_005070 [Rhodopirellula islandica]|uniref:Uncharacterized protein n=1 Tax=Rhodopirellula islandica TaxID=595434 RepID=A0A0J1EAZ1_RHOIS|nr:hypothetical protein RISK_005070 [Rhodopirellula islandica]
MLRRFEKGIRGYSLNGLKRGQWPMEKREGGERTIPSKT